jgi:hypothetical protein
MVILSARLIWLISWATRCAMGAWEVTHGQEVLAVARFVLTEAWLAAAVAGTASSAASAAARTSRDLRHLDRNWQT